MNQNTQTTNQIKPEQNVPNQNIEDDDDWEQYSDNDDFDDSNSKPESSSNSKPQTEYKDNPSSSYKPRYKKGNRYNNNYDYNYHGNKKYHKERPHGRSNNYYHTTEIKETTNKYNNDFVNMNSNYSKKPGDKRYNASSSNNNSHYGNWGRQGYNSSSRREEEDIKKPMFINSKLGNNTNPEGNFVDLEPVKDALPRFNLIPGGEIKPYDNNKKEITNAPTPTNNNDTEIEYTTDKYYGKSFGYYNYDDSKNYYGKGGKYNDRNYNGYSNRGKYKDRVGGKYLNQPERNDYKKYNNNSNTNRGKGYNNGNKFDMYEKSSSYGGGTRK